MEHWMEFKQATKSRVHSCKPLAILIYIYMVFFVTASEATARGHKSPGRGDQG